MLPFGFSGVSIWGGGGRKTVTKITAPPSQHRVRQPDVTRDKRLQAAFEEIYEPDSALGVP
jgi:hypothetical protein